LGICRVRSSVGFGDGLAAAGTAKSIVNYTGTGTIHVEINFVVAKGSDNLGRFGCVLWCDSAQLTDNGIALLSAYLMIIGIGSFQASQVSLQGSGIVSMVPQRFVDDHFRPQSCLLGQNSDESAKFGCGDSDHGSHV
jgi:hypothetical protein